MMKKMIHKVLLLSLMISCGGSNVYTQHSNKGFIAGACAIGAALIGAAGVVALVDWLSETNEQLINRIDGIHNSLYCQYAETMNYFGSRAGIGIHAPHRPIHTISESVLYEFATFVWNQGISQSDYSSGVCSAKHTLQSCIEDLHKRLRSYIGKHLTYEEHNHVSVMRNVLRKIEILLKDITLFADCLECHKTYLSLYDSVGTIRNRYLNYITILESEMYTIPMEIKHYILSCDSSQYAFKNFVHMIEVDISTLQSKVRSLVYNYESGRNYTYLLINQLINIKNIVESDPRYQQELFEWEQKCLQEQHIRMIEEQARLDRDRINILKRQNKILEERNRIELQKMQDYMCSVG